MESQNLIIHIDWSGPHSREEVLHFNGPTDRGIYQIYGCHSIYGSNVLLYIGKTASQNVKFAGRIRDSAAWSHLNSDSRNVQIYVGRLIGLSTPDNETWEHYIDLAERLLIYSHLPARNLKLEHKPSDTDLFNVHVVNWRQYRDLLPEVSGARWTDRFDHIPFQRHYTTEDFPKTTS